MKAREFLTNLYKGHVENYVTIDKLAKLNHVDVGTMVILVMLGEDLVEEDEENGTD